MVWTLDPSTPIVFLNTGFHFPETLDFKDRLVKEFDLNLIQLRSEVPRIQQRDVHGNFYFTSDVDRCCQVNKTQPMIPILSEYDIWISGLRGDQSEFRKNRELFEPAGYGCTKFHPILDWSSKMIFDYRREYQLPKHPLEEEGYLSIGCEPCTRKMNPSDLRDGRWFGLNKTECGLHTDLVEK